MYMYFCDQAASRFQIRRRFHDFGVSMARIRKWAQGNNDKRHEEAECDEVESNTARGEAASNNSHKA